MGRLHLQELSAEALDHEYGKASQTGTRKKHLLVVVIGYSYKLGQTTVIQRSNSELKSCCNDKVNGCCHIALIPFALHAYNMCGWCEAK